MSSLLTKKLSPPTQAVSRPSLGRSGLTFTTIFSVDADAQSYYAAVSLPGGAIWFMENTMMGQGGLSLAFALPCPSISAYIQVSWVIR